MMSPIERAARAISAAAHQYKDFAAPWWGEDGVQPPDTILVTEADKGLYRGQARAALEAIREPSEGMLDQGADQLFGASTDDWGADARIIWQAMIDAAMQGA